MLPAISDMYSKEELQQGLVTRVIGRKLFVFDTIDSTNACGKTLGDAGTEDGAVIIADFQANGRGRHGRFWRADSGKNLMFSLLLRPSLAKDTSGLLTFYASVSIARAIESFTGSSIECKWPNDLLLNGKKCCGILLENSFQQHELSYSVIGAGVNVNQLDFGAQLQTKATSLAKELHTEFDRKQLFQKILQEFDALYVDVQKGNFVRILEEWITRCKMLGQMVTIVQGHDTISGTALRLKDDGGLIIKTTDGNSTVYAGDVTIVA